MPPHPGCVLCVDDDEDTCTMLGSLLGLIYCHTAMAATDAEALELIARGRFDLYLLDGSVAKNFGLH